MKSISEGVRGRRQFLLGLVFGAAALTAGCGGGGGSTVTGTVKYNDQPVPSGRVLLVSSDGKEGSGAIADGKYTVTNAPSGTCKIGLIVPPASSAVPETGGGGVATPDAAMPGGKSLSTPKGMDIPGKYSNPETSGLTVNVTGNITHNIDLK